MQHARKRPLSATMQELQQAAEFIERLSSLVKEYPSFRAGAADRIVQDPQKTEVYSAESKHSKWRAHRFSCVAELMDFVREIEQSPWYRSRFGRRNIEISPGSPDQVGASGGLFFISIPPAYRRKMVVLHEVAHAVYWTPGGRAQDHGPSWCAIYLHLVGLMLGADAETELRALFDRANVRVGRKTVPLALRAPRIGAWKSAVLSKAVQTPAV